MKKYLSFLLSLGLILVLVFSSSVNVYATGTYGVNLSSAEFNSSLNPFYAKGYQGECTWYCWGRAYEKCGIALPAFNGNGSFGNAKDWYNNASAYKSAHPEAPFTVGTEPRADSIAVWTSGTTGHVAFVENISNGIMFISESNYHISPVPNHIYSDGQLNLSTGSYTNTFTNYNCNNSVMNWRTRGCPSYYIYLITAQPSTPATYTVSYNANGGEGAPASQTKTHDQTLTLSGTAPTRFGYTFLGWSTSSGATSAAYSAGGSFTVNSNTTLYAVWKERVYTGYCGGDTTAEYDVKSGAYKNLTWTLDKDGVLTIKGKGKMTHYSNYTYLPWYTYCNNIKTAVIEYGVTEIGDNMFSECRNLLSVTIPDSVTRIGGLAFNNCRSLTAVSIPDSVTAIYDYAFYYCTGLTSVTIPDSVELITSDPFSFCLNLTEINVDEDNKFFCSNSEGVLFSSDKTKMVKYPSGKKQTEYTVPDGVRTIGFGAFEACNSLTSVNIPGSVEYIGQYAFAYCDSLDSVLISNGVTDIGNSAFLKCRSLTSIHIPKSIKEIEMLAFSGCDDLEKVFFDGNAPLAVPADDSWYHSFDSTVTLCYLPSTTGWTNVPEYDETNGTWNGYTLDTWEKSGFDLSGIVTSYNPGISATVELIQKGAAVYSTTIDGTKGFGKISQRFTIDCVSPGKYDLVVTKAGHIPYKVTDIVVYDSDIDLTVSDKFYSEIKLVSGDVNGDGSVNPVDVQVVRMTSNINHSTKAATDKLADVNGDGLVNPDDVLIIRITSSMNKDARDCVFAY